MEALRYSFLLCLLMSGVAHAKLAVFDNSDGDYHWELRATPPLVSSTPFSVTVPASSQVDGDSQIPHAQKTISPWRPNITPGKSSIGGYKMRFSSQDVVREAQVGVPHHFTIPQLIDPANFVIGPELQWSGVVTIGHVGCDESHPPTEIFGIDGFIGLELTMDDGIHYGFMELAFSEFETELGRGVEAQPIRWGYETIPNTAILTIPTPTSIMLMGLSVAMLFRRST